MKQMRLKSLLEKTQKPIKESLTEEKGNIIDNNKIKREDWAKIESIEDIFGITFYQLRDEGGRKTVLFTRDGSSGRFKMDKSDLQKLVQFGILKIEFKDEDWVTIQWK